MRIAQYIDSYFPTVDGVVITVKNYAQWLNEYDHKCHVVTLDTGYYENKDPFPVYKFKSIPTFFRKEYRIALTSLDRKMVKKTENIPVDLIHTHSPFFIGNRGLKYAKKHNIPIISTFHTKFYDDFLEETGSVLIAKFMVKKIVKFYNKVDYVWTVNDQTAQTLREYGYKGKIDIMPNGFDDSFILVPKKELPDIRKEYNISDNYQIFIFVGRLTRTKNVQMTLESLALYKKEQKNFKFFVVGQGDSEKDFKTLTNDLGLSENVIFTGKIFDRRKLISLYSNADLFLFPSVYDNAPLVVREAAACETPSIVIKDSGAAQNIEDSKNGFICEEDITDFYETIKRAMKDKNKLAKIGKNAKKTIAKPWSEIVKTLTVKYEEIIKDYKANQKND